ncbi:MAG: hypothetical protein HY650_01215 [Acidobacteria bacterium]|nr:hypothetical protein [Acidobacteriota bacterium]
MPSGNANTLHAFKRAVLTLAIALAFSAQGFAQTAAAVPAKAPAKKAARSKAPAEPPHFMSLQIVQVKPDRLTEWQDLQKNETIPGLRKGGVTWRAVWQTAIFGRAYEYVIIQPIDKFAQYDQDSPLTKAWGAEGVRAYGERVRGMIDSSHTYALLARPDLSYETANFAPKMAVVTIVQVPPGRHLQLEHFIKTDVLPAMKKAGVGGYYVSQSIFGGNAYEYTAVMMVDDFAELDKGSPYVRALGKAGADRLLQKVTGLATKVDRIVSRYNADLSIDPSAPAK